MANPIMSIDKEELGELIARVAAKTMRMDFDWNWPAGVAFYGLSRAWESSGDASIVEFLRLWVDEYLELGLPPLMVNAVSMGHSLLSLYKATGERRYYEVALRKAAYLRDEAKRFAGGVFQHTVSAADDFPGQAWADTLFMAAFFLLRMGVEEGEAAWIEDALLQYRRHEELLQDPRTDLYYHAYDEATKSHLSGVRWARANAWAAVTMAEALRLIDYTYPDFMAIEGSLRDQLAALIRLQDASGLWHTILDDPDSYCETSASAGIGCALARFGRPMHAKHVVRAYEGVKAMIAPDGSVLGVSAGTAVMADAGKYALVPNKRVQGWGQGLALAFLAALRETIGARGPA
ncbi:MAG TPA: glycoside hydrolase family 88 protein [Spirochaetia bacterium]|nr:glycoside hydrolase family 88 protein [Spirochaetia bacterium]